MWTYPNHNTHKCFNQSEKRRGLLVMCYVLCTPPWQALAIARGWPANLNGDTQGTLDKRIYSHNNSTKYISTYETHCCSSPHFWLYCYAEQCFVLHSNQIFVHIHVSRSWREGWRPLRFVLRMFQMSTIVMSHHWCTDSIFKKYMLVLYELATTRIKQSIHKSMPSQNIHIYNYTNWYFLMPLVCLCFQLWFLKVHFLCWHFLRSSPSTLYWRGQKINMQRNKGVI